ncbi:MAG: hypothetical protein ACI304_08495 [Lepagella sp.]
MHLTRKNLIYIITAATAAIAITIIIYLTAAVDDGRNDTCAEMGKYTIEFAAQYSKENPEKAYTVTEEDMAVSDSLSYTKMRKFAQHMFRKGDQLVAYDYLKNCLAMMDKHPDNSDDGKKFSTLCLLLLGAATNEVGLNSLSQDYYNRGLRIDDNAIRGGYRADFLNNIGEIYKNDGKIAEAREYYNETLALAQKEQKEELLYIVYANLAELSAMENKIDDAIDYTLKSIQNLNEKSQTKEYYKMHTLIGRLHIMKGENELGLAYLNNAYNHLKGENSRAEYMEACMELMVYYGKSGDIAMMERYEREAEEIASTGNMLRSQIKFLEKKSELLATAGNTTEAYKIERQINSILDSITKRENSIRLEQANNIYNIEREEDKAKREESERKTIVLTIAIGLLSVVLIVLSGHLALTWKRKITSRAESLAEYAGQQELQLIEQKEEQARMKEDLDDHMQKLASITLERISKNEQLEEVSTEIKKILLEVSPRDKAMQEKLRALLAQVTGLKSNSQWEEFQYYFEKVHPSFYSRLDSLHPGLTAKDRRLCALISMGLSTKDIATMTYREVRSVESARNRLRKKMGLEAEENLFDYMSTLRCDHSAQEA